MWGQGLGQAAARGSLTLCMSDHGGGEEGMEHRSPGDQPAQVSSLLGSSRAFLLADSHEKGVCQDPWRRRKITRHTYRKKKTLKANKNKSPACPGEEKNKQLHWTKVRTDRKTSWPTPQGQEVPFNVLLLCSRGNTTHPETSTHWPLVSFFYF